LLEVIYLGGTIGMSESSHGWSASDENLSQIERLLAVAVPGAVVHVNVPWQPQDSSQFSPSAWDALVSEVNAVQKAADGIVVVQGTDTLAFSASVLALAAPGPAPVVVTGAQLPLAEGGRGAVEAADNLALAAQAALTVAEGAWVAFGGEVLPGFGSTKTSTLSSQGFSVPLPDWSLAGRHHHGASPLATRLSAWAGQALVHPMGAFRVPLVAVYPGFDGAGLTAMAGESCAGIVLECYGAGTAPVEGTGLENAVRAATERGIAVVVTSRCQAGLVDLDRYATGWRLADAGAINGRGLTSEAAQVAVHYLTAIGLSPPQIREVLGGTPAMAPHIHTKVGANND
jgi:L-asparaginase